MICPQRSLIMVRLKQRLSSFLLNESNHHPVVYFLIFFYFHCSLETPPESFSLVLFIIALVVAMVTNYSFIFTIAPFLQVSPIIAIPILAITLFFCNEKWKVYLFLLAIGDKVFYSSAQQYFLALFSILICFQIYHSLVFRTISDNVQYFVGLVTIASYYSISILKTNFNVEIGSLILLILILFNISLAYSFIKHRIQRLKQANPDRICSSRMMAHYLKMMQIETTDPLLLKTKILFHSRKCQLAYCFCHSQEFYGKTEYLMRQLYENALDKFPKNSDSLLYEFYIDFLLQNEQVINALHFLTKWQPNDYHSLIGRQRAKAKVERLLRDVNSSNLYELQYEYALEYDKNYQKVAEEINTILKLKRQFWGEANRQVSRVVRMQKIGNEIITRMYDLNIFYNKIIKGYEKNIFLFDTTALYAMYMISTTNFKEYAELIIKNTAKLLEEVYVFEKSASETFAIRTVVKREQTDFIAHPKNTLKPLRSVDTASTFIQINSNNCCKLIIDTVSSGFCSILSLKRSDLIGKELSTIIPDGYKQVHNVRLSYLLDFGDQSLKEIVPSKVMHKELKLPIKGTNGQLAIGYVCIKFVLDLEEGLTFVSIVKLAHDRSSHVLMNFAGQVTESQEGFNKEIVNHSEIQRYLQRLRQSWLQEKIIPEEKFNIMINTANYGITISSPLLGLFLYKENLKQKCPPIHLEIINEQTNRNRTAETDKYNKIGRQIKHMERAIYTYDAESSTTSSKRGSSAVSIISTFSEGNSTPLYRFLQLAFLATILSCVLSNLGAYFVTQLSWDVTSPQKNPINDTMNLYAIQMLTSKILIILGGEQVYFQIGGFINQTRVSQYFGVDKYEESVIKVTAQMQSAYKDSIKNCLTSPSKLFEPIIVQRFALLLNVPAPVAFAQLLNASYDQQQTYLSLLMIYVTDINLMTRLQLTDTMIAYTYSVPVSNAQKFDFLSPMIDQQVNHRQKVSIAVHASLMVVITLLLIPSFIILRKRLSIHEKIFDLLVSIDAQQVQCEIQSLDYICNILRNYKQSNQIMKMNLLGYEQNVIHPKGQRRSSSDNEMMIGLQKYDKSNQEYEVKIKKRTHFQPTSSQKDTTRSRKSIDRRVLQLESIVGTIKNNVTLTQPEKLSNKRKRSGELDLTGSMLDPSKKIIKDHWILYIVSLSFLLILGLSLHFQLKFNSTYLKGKDDLLKAYKDQIDFEGNLLVSKLMLMEGPQFFASFLGFANALDYFIILLNGFPTYNYYDNQQIYSQVIHNCSMKSTLAPSFVSKYCQLDYSQIILKGEFGTLGKQFTQLRYLMDTSPSYAANAASIMQNILQKLYYLESLNLRLEELVLQKVEILFESLMQQGKDYKDTKILIVVLSILWGIVCCVCGFGVVLKMKEEYFREVFMITFLNNQMITKNKRVQSFLQLIAKSTSN